MSIKRGCFMDDHFRKRGREQGLWSSDKLLVDPEPLVAITGTSSHVCTTGDFAISNRRPCFHYVPHVMSEMTLFQSS